MSIIHDAFVLHYAVVSMVSDSIDKNLLMLAYSGLEYSHDLSSTLDKFNYYNFYLMKLVL